MTGGIEAFPFGEDVKVEAEGSLWRLYFPKDETPTEDEVHDALGAVKTTLITPPGELALVTPRG